MRLVAVLLASLTTGCAVLCGPTIYWLGGVSAGALVDAGPWDPTRAQEGLSAAGMTPTMGTECSVNGRQGNVSMSVNACDRLNTHLSLWWKGPDIRGTRDEVEAEAARLKAAYAPEADALVAAFVDATGWAVVRELSWTHSTAHGDC